MKTKKILLSLAILFGAFNLKAQPTTPVDFSIIDCNGNPHHLFSDLDAGKVVIMEYFMTSCAGCVIAGDALEPMKAALLAKFPGKIKSYDFAFNNTYNCATVNNWVTTNGYSAVPSDSGAYQVAYYGGMGMPTIVIAAGVGSDHKLLLDPYVGFDNNDTIAMANAIRSFLTGSGIVESLNPFNAVDVFPVPSNNQLNLAIDLKSKSNVRVELIDFTGRLVTTLVNENILQGKTNKVFDTNNYAEGNYILKISTDNSIQSKKINIIH
jgi:hypothetical protein